MAVAAYPIKARRKIGRFDLFEEIASSMPGTKLHDGDVLVISSKYLSVSQGRIVQAAGISESAQAMALARAFRMPPKLAEAVIRESDHILGGVPGFALASANGMVAPNAGIDRSNADGESFILYPSRPREAAEIVRRKIFLRHNASAGVVISDSRLMPGRAGTVGVALACSGIRAVLDMRGCLDLDGASLKVTQQAIADGLASIGNYVMGEGSQSIPAALIRGSQAVATGSDGPEEMTIEPSQCIYLRSMSTTR